MIPQWLPLTLCLALPAWAGSPSLSGVTPPGAQRGSELKVTFSGKRLEETQDLLFHTPGLQLLQLESVKANSVSARLKIADDCPLGEHHLRLRTAGGLTELRTFYISPFPQIAETEPNNDRVKAQLVSLNSTLSGACGQDDIDTFAFDAKAGQTLCAQVEGMRLGRALLDITVKFLDTNGVVVASADDSTFLQQDPLLFFSVPTDGRYYVQVHETTYGGTADSAYRLHLGTFFQPTLVFPLGGPAGAKIPVQFLGDPRGAWSQEITLPATPEERWPLFARHNELEAPAPNWMRVSSFTNVFEASPNATRQQATPFTNALPVAFNGIVSQAHEADWFSFVAQKGRALELVVYARRLRSPLDSVLELYNAKGERLAQNDDGTGPDSFLKFTPPEEGTYFLRLTDQLARGGEEFAYRVEITPVSPSLALFIPQVARNDSQTRQFIVVPRGNRTATVISARRSNAPGDLSLRIDPLPEGVSLEPPLMSARQDAMPLVFSATDQAPLQGRLVTVTAATTNGVEGSFRQDLELIYGPNNTVFYTTQARQLGVAVAEAAPFKVELVEPKVPLVQGGTMTLQVRAERQPGFEEPITLKMVWNPAGISSQPEIILPKGSHSVAFPLNANADAALATWKIALLASSPVKGGPVFVSTQLASLVVSEPFLTGKIEPARSEPGQTVKMVCKLEQKKPFEGTATLRLMGLPEKVSAPDKQFTSKDTEVTFEVVIEPTAPLGSNKALFCRVDLAHQGEVIPHSLAQGSILRIVPPKAPKPDAKLATAKPAAPGK